MFTVQGSCWYSARIHVCQLRTAGCFMDSFEQTVNIGDIPGASLNGRDPATLKILELKRWLDCRGASVRGKKADVVMRSVCVSVPCHFKCVYII